MSVLEVGRPVIAAPENYDNLSYDETTALMQAVVPAGLDQLMPHQMETLSQLTARLAAVRGDRAVAEYDRYNAVKDRRLDVPDDLLREQLSGKTILVNGGTGLIGSALLDTISHFGPARMVSLSRGETPTWKEIEGVEYITGVDIRDRATMMRIVGDLNPDIIYHVAAYKYNAEAETLANHTLTTNILGVENVIAAAEAAGTPLVVQASTGKASRPYSPDIYASSKKTGELLFARAAKTGKFTCAAARFTHVVDDSNVRRVVNAQIDQGGPVRLQAPDIPMYIQSAYESAQLLLVSGLEAKPGELRVQAIRELDGYITLGELGLGAIVKKGERVPIYFQGVTPGYEDTAWDLLHGRNNFGKSPLLNSIEVHDVEAARSCPEVDSFPLEIAASDDVKFALDALKDAFDISDGPKLRELNQELAWAMLDARIAKLPTEVVEAICKPIQKAPEKIIAKNPEEFGRTNQAFLRELAARQAAVRTA
ncbi:MAG: polysaccharide biosynthesis protein [Candidatus Saccharimonadales bacterium]